MKGTVNVYQGYPYIEVDLPPHGLVDIFRFSQKNHMLKEDIVALGPEFADKLDYVEFEGLSLSHHVKNKSLAKLVNKFANGSDLYSLPGTEVEAPD